MKASVPLAVEQAARELHLETHVDPLHGAQGIELRKRVEGSDTLICIGYYLHSPERMEIYRMTRSKRDEVCRTRLWFFWGWLIKPRRQDNQYELLQSVPPSEFDEKVFIERVKKELA